jgi:hypothetical protein
MQSTNRFLGKLTAAVACAVMVFGAAATYAADADGTWSWTTPGRNGAEGRKMTLKLKTEGEKLTGSVTAPGRQGAEPKPVQIADGKVKGDEISFNVTREFNGNSNTTKYTGKVSGDSIKGKATSKNRDGEERARDWEAKRDK